MKYSASIFALGFAVGTFGAAWMAASAMAESLSGHRPPREIILSQRGAEQAIQLSMPDQKERREMKALGEEERRAEEVRKTVEEAQVQLAQKGPKGDVKKAKKKKIQKPAAGEPTSIDLEELDRE